MSFIGDHLKKDGLHSTTRKKRIEVSASALTLEQEFMIVSRSADMGSLTNFSQRSIGANEGSTTTVFASIDNDSLLDHYSGALHFDIHLNVNSTTCGQVNVHVRFLFSDQYPWDGIPTEMVLIKGDNQVKKVWLDIVRPVVTLMERRANDEKRCLEASVRKLCRQLVLHLQGGVVAAPSPASTTSVNNSNSTRNNSNDRLELLGWEMEGLENVASGETIRRNSVVTKRLRPPTFEAFAKQQKDAGAAAKAAEEKEEEDEEVRAEEDDNDDDNDDGTDDEEDNETDQGNESEEEGKKTYATTSLKQLHSKNRKKKNSPNRSEKSRRRKKRHTPKLSALRASLQKMRSGRKNNKKPSRLTAGEIFSNATPIRKAVDAHHRRLHMTPRCCAILCGTKLIMLGLRLDPNVASSTQR